jgi:hypothetical protein
VLVGDARRWQKAEFKKKDTAMVELFRSNWQRQRARSEEGGESLIKGVRGCWR